MDSQIPQVDYTEHPAFQYERLTSVLVDQKTAHIIDKLDKALSTLWPKVKNRQGVQLAEFDVIQSQAMALIAFLNEECRHLPSKIRQIVSLSIEASLKHIESEIQQYSRPFNSIAFSSQAHELADRLDQKGIVFAPFLEKKPLQESLAAPMAYMRNFAKEHPFTRRSRPLVLENAYWKLLKNHIYRSGLVDAASIYQGFQLEPAYCALSYEDPKQTWYKNCYDISTSDTAYLHYDHDFEVLKIILYVADVEPYNGPYSYIPNSHFSVHSTFLSYFYRHFDVIAEQFFPSNSTYYRPRFQLEPFRKEFIQLPKPLQGSSHFGDDIMNNSALSQQLLSLEQKVLSKDNNCFLFAGSRLIHRGGLVEQGERFTLQIGLFPQPDMLRRIKRGARRQMGKTARRILGKQKVLFSDGA